MREQPAKKETVFKGVPASPGIAMGTAFLFVKELPRVEEWTIEPEQVAAEVERLDKALEKSSKELNKILTFAQQKVGEVKAKILDAQIMVLEDQILIGGIKKRIRSEHKNAEFLVADEIGKYAALMMQAHDEYMHERAHDMEDLRNRVVRNLQQEKLISKIEGQLIVVAHNLTPADTMILSRNHVLGYATDLGGVTSHAALFSRALKIPAITGLGDISRTIQTGDPVILDGYSGTFIIHPTPRRIAEFEKKREHFQAFEVQLAALKDLPAKTTDGHNIELSANIELPEELEYVVVQGSQGVGLFRTESMLVERDDFPSEEEQYREYTKVAARLYPNRVIMRTFDVGGDKLAPETAEEANPFLGWRGIRVSLDRPDIFTAQLRAMLRASTRKNMAIMFPMITNITEVRTANAFVRKVKAELKAKKIKFDEKIPVGVMIEVPAAAMMADQIAAEVDFLSIGSNDLTQYLLAVDRGNNLVSSLYKEFEPSVISMLRHIIDAGHKRKIWVGLCGEMAGNPLATPLLVGMGIDELSVFPGILPEIKKIIRSLSHKEAKDLAQAVTAFSTADDVEHHLRHFFLKHFPDIPIEDE
jgi:phosphoenolpyruvate-protein phosphotransferase (PTS system enzyme I)